MSSAFASTPRPMLDPSTRYLHPGDVIVSAEPVWITTILGSCVAICLWDAARGVGGMNHFLLPARVHNTTRSPRFGDSAIEVLLQRLAQAGAQPHALQALVFGGACVIPTNAPPDRHLGAQNVECAFRELDRRGIPIRHHATGGTRGRRLRFHTGTGEAVLKQL